jgi:hypothetical protein
MHIIYQLCNIYWVDMLAPPIPHPLVLALERPGTEASPMQTLVRLKVNLVFSGAASKVIQYPILLSKARLF